MEQLLEVVVGALLFAVGVGVTAWVVLWRRRRF